MRRSCSVIVSASSDDQPDFVERWYGKIFGKKALEDRNPFGMKRLVRPQLAVQARMYTRICDFRSYAMHVRN